jgi:hypothetical protein
MSEQKQNSVTREIDNIVFSKQTGRMLAMPFSMLLITAIIFGAQIYLEGYAQRVAIIVFASLVSMPILFLYPLQTPRNGKAPTPGLLKMLIGLGSFIPYLLGCYLVFYEGLWRLVRVFDNFSLVTVVIALAFIVIGYIIVNGCYKLTEVCRAVNDGRLIVRSST